ncbi:MAG: Gmad2 immunoglobulin-like domain-containing protein [Rubrobacteraceae bacterium]
MRRLFALLFVSALVVLPVGTASAKPMVADTLRDVRSGDHGTYERMVLDLGSSKAPADYTPYYSWARVAGGTVVRIQLPTVDSTLKTDGKGLGGGISRYYVVREKSGGSMFVDVHLKDTAGPVNVFYLNYPGRIVIDVPTGGSLNPYPKAAFGKNVVLMQPRAGYIVGPDIFTAEGYGRPFEATGSWRLKDSTGAVVSRGSYKTSDWAETWGRFSFSLDYPASLGGSSGTLEVGRYSARNGSFEGVSVPLKFR